MLIVMLGMAAIEDGKNGGDTSVIATGNASWLGVIWLSFGRVVGAESVSDEMEDEPK
jgi:hypothetical protein